MNPLEILIRKEERESRYSELHRCLDLLTSEERNLIQALFYDELTETEYAHLMDTTKEGVNAEKNRILAKLRKSWNI